MSFTTDKPPTTNNNKGGGDGNGKSSPIPDSLPALFPLVLGGAFIIGLILAFLIIWVTRRRRAQTGADKPAKGDEAVLLSPEGSTGLPSSGEEVKDGGGGMGSTARRRLQKACPVGAGPGWWAREGGSGLLSDDEDGEGRGWPRRHVSLPLIPRACSRGHFHFGGGEGWGSSCRWPGQGQGKGAVEMEEVRGVCRRKQPSWIDEDALHGPKVVVKGGAGGGGGKKKKNERGSWPLRNRAPTLPRVHHTVHGYPYLVSGGRGKSSEALLGESRLQTTTGMEYAQLRASSRDLPQPPKPALVSNRDKRVIRPSVTMGYVYGASKIPQPIVSPPVSPVRSAPTTPQRHRGRQRSTDSTLSDILRSTEERLREGSVSGTIRSRRATTSPTRASPSKVFGPREYGIQVSRARTPSPKKTAPMESFTPDHKRQDSQKSVSSETDSLAGEECPVSDAPSGLTSPSRVQKKQEPEKQPPQAQSVRTSLSSELSTLYSEDEMPDEVKRAIMPLEGLIVQPQQAANVRPPTMNDPFVSGPLPLSVSRASSVGAWPTKHSKPQDLLRQSVQWSQRLRSMTVGHTRAHSQGLILAPGPVIRGSKSALLPVISPSRKVSVTIPRSIQPYLASRASEPPPSPTRQSPTTHSPTGPLFLRVTKTSTLSTMPLLPPPSAPGIDTSRESKSNPPSPTTTAQAPSDQHQQQQPARRSPVLMLPSTEPPSTPSSSSPTRRMRLSLILPPKQQHQQQQQPQDPQQQHSLKRSSASSSVYSQQEPTPPTTAQAAATAAIELNRANFRANSSLYPAPLSPTRSSRGGRASPSKLSSEVLPLGKDGNEGGEEEGDEDEDEDTPLALTCTIASLRRMNSGVSAASSLGSIADRRGMLTPSPSPSPERVLPGLAIKSVSPVRVGGGGGDEHRKSIGARNYFILGNGNGAVGGQQSRRGSRVVSCGSVGSGIRRSSAVLRLSRSEFAVAAGEEGKENGAGSGEGRFKVAAGEFTFEVSNPNVSGKGALGLREGSSGSVNALVMPQQGDRRLSLAWKPAEGGASRNGSPVRYNVSPSRQSLRSVDSLGLYDRQGFLISASPVRGVSPSGLRV
ncbi:hypothetical protein C8A01DRAFT_12981 [Parachaetomium inaequale]|uniref:Uncharacterized protein n=1 Tax=Parachaetomium inaequale TaxID=2588326 RepID=A0AAN6SUD3_9PEZI|nr:hypothetical protein C8A01DRAFT_12981 [Parachaetomium inaequale]